MSEAPKKIWWRMDGPLIGWAELEENSHPDDIPYIRADIVDELVESLQKCWMVMNSGGTWTLEDQDKTKAALKKLEESHE